jgi:hypothetical protein
MALVLKDRVKQTATAPGTGTITLLTTPTGFQSFSAVGDGNTTYFAIVDPTSGAWEVNYGTYTSSGTTLSRNSPPLSSSNSGSLVNFTGAVDVFLTYPSESAVWRDTAGVVAQQSFGAITATSAALTTGTVSTTPASNTDIANKQYVDGLVTQGISYHEPVYVESPNTAGNLNATYANGGTNINVIDIANGSDLTFFGAPPAIGDQLLTSTGNGLVAGTEYWVVAAVGAARQISLTYGGAPITSLTNGSVTIPTRYNDGVGATLTNAGTQAALTVDGVLMTVGKRVLVYNQTNQFENGVYEVTTVGDGSTNWVLTRTTDADTYGVRTPNALGYNDAFFVTNGSTGAGETYVVTTTAAIFFGITTITFAQISSAQVYNAGTGLNLSPATTFNISNTGVSANTYGSASAVPVITVNAQGQATSITNTNIAINGTQVSGNITGSAGSVANALTLGTYLTGTSFNGSTAVTATVDATSANTASKVVARDASGDFSAGTITATLSGSSTSATTATNLAGGTANQIPFQASAGTTSFAAAPSATGDLLNWNGSAFAWTQTPSITGITLNGGTANGVTYLNGSKVLTSGTALVFDGTNLGVAVTPSVWGLGKAIEVGNVGNAIWGASAGNMLVAANMYYSGGYKYAATGAASQYQQNAGAHQWFNAPSGTAGNAITFTQAMTLDASGNLDLGTTTSYGGRLTLIPSANPTTASDTANQLAIGEASKNSAYKMLVGYINIGGGYASSIQSIAGATGASLLLNADGGNVGIGTSSPSVYGKLAVFSGSTASIAYFDTTAATAYSGGSFFSGANINIRTGANATGNGSGIRFASSNNGALEGLFGWVQNASGYGDFVFQGYNGSAYAERFRFGSAGQLGIGGATYGTAGQVLTSGGSGAAPTWSTPSGSAATPTALGTVYGKMTNAGGTPYLTALGYNAGVLVTGTDNTAVGLEALSATIGGSSNVAVGNYTLQANVSGVQNTAVGYSALNNNSGDYNVAVGYTALQNKPGGNSNVAMGYAALRNLTGGNSNTAIGDAAAQLGSATFTGIVAIGYRALRNNTASSSVAVGQSALLNATSGLNTGVGSSAGSTITTGSGNVCLGDSTQTSVATATNQIVIGTGVTGQGNSYITMGSSTAKVYNNYAVNATWTQTSDVRLKNIIGPDTLGLSFINRLNPIKYTWKAQNELPTDNPYYNEINSRDTETVIHGFVAQEIKAAMDAENCTTFNGWDEGPDGIQAISREMLVSPLVKAIQELSAKLDALEAKHNAYVASHP